MRPTLCAEVLICAPSHTEAPRVNLFLSAILTLCARMVHTARMSNSEGARSPRFHVWTIGDRLRVARLSVTDNQSEFADMIGIARRTISRYEGLDILPKR